VEQDKIVEFLIRAKKATYAGKGPEGLPSRPNSHDLKYKENNLLYIDTYLGGEKFAGEEALWEKDIPFWVMNYYGRVIGNGFSGNFLKDALLNVPKDMPYRGPKEFKVNDYIYRCTVDGGFQWFIGYEEIYNGVNKVYECRFHGGIVK